MIGAAQGPQSAAGGAVMLASHGTVDRLDDLAAFATNVRRGRPAPPELVSELRRRYEAIGGRSPLNETNAKLANKLSVALGLPVACANRLWEPSTREVLGGLVREGARKVALVPLAPFSAHIYEADARRECEGLDVALVCASSWGQDPQLAALFCDRIERELARDPVQPTTLILSAHSLPRAIVAAGDPYECDVRAAAVAVAKELERRRGPVRWTLAFQSQGLSGAADSWLGPDLRSTLDQCAARGDGRVVVSAIGFLSDHVETLYDLDIEAAAMAHERGLSFARARSLDADDDLVELLARLSRELLAVAGGSPPR
jgi:ferrochelatase